MVAGVCMDVLAAMAQGGPSNRTALVQEVTHTEYSLPWREMHMQTSHRREKPWLTCVWIAGRLCVVCVGVCAVGD